MCNSTLSCFFIDSHSVVAQEWQQMTMCRVTTCCVFCMKIPVAATAVQNCNFQSQLKNLTAINIFCINRSVNCD